jgi:hypothetical protein
MSNVIPIRRHVSESPPEYDGGDGGGDIRIVIELEGLEELNRALEAQNRAVEELLETVEEEPKKRRGGWLWFLIGAALGLGIG